MKLAKIASLSKIHHTIKRKKYEMKYKNKNKKELNKLNIIINLIN